MERTKSQKLVRVLKYVAVLLVVAALATTLGILASQLKARQNELENLYQKSYFESMEKLNDLELKLSKLQVAAAPANQRSLLSEMWGDSAVVEAGLSNLTVGDTDSTGVLSFFNKLGDYAKALSASIDEGGLTTEQLAALDKLHIAVLSLKKELQAVETEILSGGKLLASFGSSLNFVGASFAGINNTSLDLPQLIYDGPFSDGLNDRETKALHGLPEVSVDDAAAQVAKLFPNAEIALSTQSDGDIATYVFQLSGTVNGSVQVSKIGGMVTLIDIYADPIDSTISEADAVILAKQFVTAAGYADMQEVWVSNNNSTYYINFAYTANGITFYPDLIKIKVAGDTGAIVGLEARNYIFNHTARTVATPKPEAEARQALSKRVSVQSHRLCLIPTEWNAEVLSYEYAVAYGSDTYYVYVDAVECSEIKVLKVVEDDGRLIA